MLKSTERGVIGDAGQGAVAAFSAANRRNSVLGKLRRNRGVDGEWHKPESKTQSFLN